MTDTSVQEAQSPDKVLTREDVLRLIPQFEMEPLFKRHHLNREVIIGIIGLRGDGKSATTASISLVDYMFEHKKVWSNMLVKCDIQVGDEKAQKYGLSRGGVVHFQSEPLEKQALLELDERYRGGCLAIEEINVQYSNVRRFMTNTNVDFNIVIQQLRKFETSLIYNVIDEMFVDSQLRALTDVFIKCEETALSVGGLAQRKQPGVDFKWITYPMSGYLVGREFSYYVTKKPLAPVYFHFAPLRGIYDDKHYQRKGVYSAKTRNGKSMDVEMVTESSPEMRQETDEWAWLEEKTLALKNSGIEFIKDYELWQALEVARMRKSTRKVGEILPQFGIFRDHQTTNGRWVYRINQFNLEKLTNKPTVEMQRV